MYLDLFSHPFILLECNLIIFILSSHDQCSCWAKQLLWAIFVLTITALLTF